MWKQLNNLAGDTGHFDGMDPDTIAKLEAIVRSPRQDQWCKRDLRRYIRLCFVRRKDRARSSA